MSVFFRRLNCKIDVLVHNVLLCCGWCALYTIPDCDGQIGSHVGKGWQFPFALVCARCMHSLHFVNVRFEAHVFKLANSDESKTDRPTGIIACSLHLSRLYGWEVIHAVV
jgi:hypothetical protein